MAANYEIPMALSEHPGYDYYTRPEDRPILVPGQGNRCVIHPPVPPPLPPRNTEKDSELQTTDSSTSTAPTRCAIRRPWRDIIALSTGFVLGIIVGLVVRFLIYPATADDGMVVKCSELEYHADPSGVIPFSYSTLPEFPGFNCAPMNEVECAAMMQPLMAPRAVLHLTARIKPASILRHLTESLIRRIENCAGSSAIRLIIDDKNIRTLPMGLQVVPAKRAISLEIYEYTLTEHNPDTGELKEIIDLAEAVVPVRANIIELTFLYCENRCSGRLPALRLTNLLTFAIETCVYINNQGVVIQRDDFAHSQRLLAVTITGCAVVDVQEYAFSDLPDLRIIALGVNLTKDRRGLRLRPDPLHLYHCERSYLWLRRMFRNNPDLIAPKEQGSLYEICRVKNRAYKSEDINIPVSCARNSTMAMTRVYKQVV